MQPQPRCLAGDQANSWSQVMDRPSQSTSLHRCCVQSNRHSPNNNLISLTRILWVKANSVLFLSNATNSTLLSMPLMPARTNTWLFACFVW